MKPKGIIWIITARCNLRCRHCYSTMYERERELKAGEVLRILKEAADEGVEFVNLTGGEPLLRRDLFEMLEKGRELGLHMSIFSNLTLMNEERADSLYRLEVPVYTSMDGPNRRVHESMRGENSWGPFIKGLKMLLDRGIKVHVNIAVSKENWFHIPKTVDKAREMGVESISVIPVMKAGRAVTTNVYVSRDEFLKAVEGLKDVAVWCAPFIQGSSCKEWRIMDISPSGRFLLCDVLNYEVADVTKLGIKASWDALYKDAVYRRIMATPKECLSCPLSRTCRGGCYARSWPTLGKDPLCPY